jgi:hypothetical protein
MSSTGDAAPAGTSHCFRLRFDVHGLMRIGSDQQTHVLEAVDKERVILEITDPETGHGSPKHTSVIVTGYGYGSALAATAAGERWAPTLQRAFASFGVGADLGTRRVTDPWHETESGDGAPEVVAGYQFLYDKPGLTLFLESPTPVFAERDASAWIGRAPVQFVEAVERIRAANAQLTPLEQTAYELYSSSFSAASADAPFIVLMMAVETLIEPQGRTRAVVDHLDNLIEQTEQSDLPPNEINSIVRSLGSMRSESIGQAGRRLVKGLGDVKFNGLNADKFFTQCYDLRSDLVHGKHPRPDGPTIDAYTEPLESLVAALLATPSRSAAVVEAD